jgi:hypothetical protein
MAWERLQPPLQRHVPIASKQRLRVTCQCVRSACHVIDRTRVQFFAMGQRAKKQVKVTAWWTSGRVIFPTEHCPHAAHLSRSISADERQ